MPKIAFTAAALLVLSTGAAFAVSKEVRQACTSDYAAYCSEHKVGTSGLKSCMRAHRKMLTDACIHALGSSSEVTAADIKRYKRETGK